MAGSTPDTAYTLTCTARAASVVIIDLDGLASIDTDGLCFGAESLCLCDLAIDTSSSGAVAHLPGLSILSGWIHIIAVQGSCRRGC